MTAHWEVSLKDISFGKLLVAVMVVVFLVLGIYNNFVIEERNDKLEKQELVKVNEEVSEGIAREDNAIDKKESLVYVHVTGAIKNPGLYKLKEGSRLDDLVKAAGGLKKDADISKINLSMILEDEMRLHLLSIGEADIKETSEDNQLPKDSGKININKASLSELMTLPGIGEKRAQDIIEFREKTRIKKAEDLKEVSGFGEKSIEKLRDLISYWFLILTSFFVIIALL